MILRENLFTTETLRHGENNPWFVIPTAGRNLLLLEESKS
jgi:hypothetical protein